MYIRSGLGSTTSVTAATIAQQGASTTASLLAAFGVIGGGNTNSSGNSSGNGTGGTSAYGPVGAAIAGIAAIATLLVKLFQGCGQTCVAASTYANQVESQLLQPNLQAYISSPVRTTSMQAAAINNYNTAIASLEQACGQASLGSAGTNCIDERVDASSCQWKTSPGGWTTNADGTCTYTPPGASGSGNTCWNWVVGYLDPIQNDPCVQSDSVLTSSTASGASSVFGIPIPVAIGALLVGAFVLGGD